MPDDCMHAVLNPDGENEAGVPLYRCDACGLLGTWSWFAFISDWRSSREQRLPKETH